MWELDYKKSWAQKNWCFWTVVLEKTLESPMDCNEIKPVNLEGNQSWIFIERTDAEADSSIIWPPEAKNWLCKRPLILGRKVMTNLDSVFKSRDITLPTKLCLVNAMVFPVVMYGCENCTIKKTEHQSTDAFELWCWTRLLGFPWTVRRSTQTILKETSPEYSWEGLMLKLKLQYFGHLMQRGY